jgi:ubiquitin-conjugating enzyme E2 D/E
MKKSESEALEMDSLSADILSCVALHLPFFECVALQQVSKRFFSGLRRTVVWQRWGATCFADMVERAKAVPVRRRKHLWSLTHTALAEIGRMPPSYGRLTKELQDLRAEPLANANAGPVDARNNFLEWEAYIVGPKDTVYEGGVFRLTLRYPTDYPFKPPRIRFLNGIYHPNCNREGAISLDILKDCWSPALTVSKVLLSIAAFMCEPNPDDPLVPEVARLMKTDRAKYDATAREHTRQHAWSQELPKFDA